MLCCQYFKRFTLFFFINLCYNNIVITSKKLRRHFMNTSNITELTQSAQITLSQNAFTMRDSKIYRAYTERFQVFVGNLIYQEFPGITTELKVRVKSPKSISKKISKNSKLYAKEQINSDSIIDISKYSLYDIYGAKFVVLSVEDTFCSKHICIDGYLENRKKSRKKLNEAIATYENNPTETNSKIVELSHIIYHMIDTACQRALAEAICNFIINSKELQEEFGIYNIESRFRNYNTSNEYIAQHITLGSTKLSGWFIEIQFKSITDYEIARTGEASHLTRDGKSITIPNSLSDIDPDSIPEYWVYVPNGLFIPSKKECAFHHLLAAFYQKKGFSENPKKLMELFKDFSESDIGTFKQVI